MGNSFMLQGSLRVAAYIDRGKGRERKPLRGHQSKGASHFFLKMEAQQKWLALQIRVCLTVPKGFKRIRQVGSELAKLAMPRNVGGLKRPWLIGSVAF